MAIGADPLQKAIYLHKAGELAQAERLYREILAADPQHAEALHLLGLVAHQSGHHEQAIECILRAIAVCPTRAVYFNSLGEAHRAMGHEPQARAAYEQAIKLFPGFGPAHYNLGLLYAATNPAQAQHHYEKAVELTPRNAPAFNNLGNVLRAQGKLEEARVAYEHALQLLPEYPEAQSNLGSLLKEMGRVEEANEHIEKASKLFYFNISHAYKCIFIHIPKNGGTSIKQVLDLPGGGHRTWQFYAKNHLYLWQQYTSFAVVRNPWDRLVSAYQHARMKESYWHTDNERMHPDYKLLAEKSFAECAAIMARQPELLKHESFSSQLRWVADTESAEKKVLVSTLLRFESLDADFHALCQRLGVPCEQLPAVNRSERMADYRGYYTDETRRMIEEVFRDDIAAFGYSF